MLTVVPLLPTPSPEDATGEGAAMRRAGRTADLQRAQEQ